MSSRISVIALEQLPEMEVIEELDTETILDTRMGKLVEFWRAADPPAGAVYDVDQLEFDPLRINQEASTFFETLLRDRVNQAARAVTLAYATGGDLDAIASRYPGGVPRLAVVDAPGDYETYPLDWEDDDRYRRRILLSPNLLSPHGSYEAYIFWAMTADVTLHDASATSERGTGRIKVSIMADGDSPIPTTEQITTVYNYIYDQARRGLTDDVSVLPVKVTAINYRVRVWLFPGFDKDTILTQLQTRVEELVENQRWIGFDHTLMALEAALTMPGVYNVAIDEPTKDVVVGLDTVVKVNSITISYISRGE